MDGLGCPPGIPKLVAQNHDSNLITDLTLTLQAAWPKIQLAYAKIRPGCHLRPVFTHRTPEHQLALYRQGRVNAGSVQQPSWEVADPGQVVTNCDGYLRVSAHNFYPARAIDIVAIDQSGKENWNDAYYTPFGPICDKLGLIWGGSWLTFKDMDHIEVPQYKLFVETLKKL